MKIEKTITQSEFWVLLIGTFPTLAFLQNSARLARGETYLSKDELLHPENEIAIIPPVSGG